MPRPDTERLFNEVSRRLRRLDADVRQEALYRTYRALAAGRLNLGDDPVAVMTSFAMNTAKRIERERPVVRRKFDVVLTETYIPSVSMSPHDVFLVQSIYQQCTRVEREMLIAIAETESISEAARKLGLNERTFFTRLRRLRRWAKKFE